MEMIDKFNSISQIIDVFQIISIGRKSGKVTFSGKDGEVNFFFMNGMLVWLSSNVFLLRKNIERFKKGELSLKEFAKAALHYVNCWETGNVKFIEKKYDIPVKESEEILNIIMELLKEIDELPPVFKKLISSEKILIFSGEINSEKTVLDKKDVELIYHFLQGKKIKEVVFANPPLVDAAERVLKFVSSGLMIPVREAGSEIIPYMKSPSVPLSCFDKLKSLFVEIFGPIGVYIIDDALRDFGLPEIPYKSLDKFIDILMEKIPEENVFKEKNFKETLRKRVKEVLVRS